MCELEHEYFIDIINRPERIFLRVTCYYPQLNLAFEPNLTKMQILSKGGQVHDTFQGDVTHVIVDPTQDMDSFNMVRSVTNQVHLVSFHWITDSLLAEKRLDERKYAKI